MATTLSDIKLVLELGEASGTRVDSIAGRNFTDINTVTQAAGKVGNAAQFTAANVESLSRDSESALLPGPAFFVNFWVYADANTAGVICCKDNIISREWEMDWDSGGIRYLVFDSIAGNSNAPTEGLSLATWYNICGWYNPADKKPYMAVNDGTPIVGSALTTGIPTNGTAAFELGNRVGFNNPLDGRIDQFVYGQVVPSAADITWFYNSGNGRSYAEIVTQYGASTPANRLLTRQAVKRAAFY